MQATVDVVLHAGRSAVDVALYTLLPIMVVMMILMRLLEAAGVIDRLVRLSAPLVRPFGLTGLGLLAMIQISFVSFVAPLPTLALMEDRGASDRHLAATLAALLAMAPANATFPLAAEGLHAGLTMAMSVIGGLAASTLTYRLFGCRMSRASHAITEFERRATDSPSLLKLINVSGSEAIQIVLNIIPMLLLSLAVVFALETIGSIDWLVRLLTPALTRAGINQAFILPTITKYIAGSTAVVGVITEMVKDGQIGPALINRGSGFLLHPLDLPGVSILLSAGPRLSRTFAPALGGAIIGISIRTFGTFLLP